MTEHIHIHGFQVDGLIGIYDIDIFQCAYDEICIDVCNTIYRYEVRTHHQFDIPIKKAPGYTWKCNTASIGENEGKAENIIKFFKDYDSFARASVRKLIFEHPKKRATPGL